MKQYEFVNVSTWEMFRGYSLDNQHREIIQQYAQNGWRYVGYIPTGEMEGKTMSIDLIFEKDKDE